MGLGSRGWRRVGLGEEMGEFRDQGWRRVALGVEMDEFREQGVEMSRFRCGYGCVWGSGGGDGCI